MPRTEPMVILIVDDDLSLLGMLSLKLEQAGYKVLTASNHESAIDFFSRSPINILLLDLGMPPNEHTPEEGLKVLVWVKKHHPSCHPIVLTGQDKDSSAYQAIQHGAFDFLEKPVNSKILLSSIKRAQVFHQNRERLAAENGQHNIELAAEEGQGVKMIRNQAEEKLLRHVLSDTDFNVHETSRRLALKRENIYYLIKKYQIQRPELDA